MTAGDLLEVAGTLCLAAAGYLLGGAAAALIVVGAGLIYEAQGLATVKVTRPRLTLGRRPLSALRFLAPILPRGRRREVSPFTSEATE